MRTKNIHYLFLIITLWIALFSCNNKKQIIIEGKWDYQMEESIQSNLGSKVIDITYGTIEFNTDGSGSRTESESAYSAKFHWVRIKNKLNIKYDSDDEESFLLNTDQTGLELTSAETTQSSSIHQVINLHLISISEK